MDAVAKDGKIIAYVICGHTEFAGVHSGVEKPERTFSFLLFFQLCSTMSHS